MYKQAHIVVAEFIADEMQRKELKEHRTSFCLGSVLPDMSPRMRMKDHEFAETWEDIKERIHQISTAAVTDDESGRKVCRQIGIVMHYLADYFTCPHNPSYGINLIEHSFYEGEEAYEIRFYLRSPKAKERFLSRQNYAKKILTEEELFSYIEQMHALYLRMPKHTPKNDCRWVLDACSCTALVLTSMVFDENKK